MQTKASINRDIQILKVLHRRHKKSLKQQKDVKKKKEKEKKRKERIDNEIFEYKPDLEKPRFVIQIISQKKSKGSKWERD
jgi:hypothetical protein